MLTMNAKKSWNRFFYGSEKGYKREEKAATRSRDDMFEDSWWEDL
jgi:hypothetical protein